MHQQQTFSNAEIAWEDADERFNVGVGRTREGKVSVCRVGKPHHQRAMVSGRERSSGEYFFDIEPNAMTLSIMRIIATEFSLSA